MTLAERMRLVAGDLSFDEVARRTGANHENVRRHLQGTGRLPAEFLRAFCQTFGVSADWLLEGTGPVRRRGSGATRRNTIPAEAVSAKVIAAELDAAIRRLRALRATLPLRGRPR